MRYIIMLVFLMASACAWAYPCAYADVPDDKAVLAIIGEFENDNIEAGACALYNRGTLKGVYGLNSKRVIKRLYSPLIYKRAVRAWQMAKSGQGCAIMSGSDHWQSLADMEKPLKWRDKCIQTYKTNKTVFFKCKGR